MFVTKQFQFHERLTRWLPVKKINTVYVEPREEIILCPETF